MRYGTRRQLRSAGLGPADLADLDQLREAYEDFLRGKRSRADVEPLFRAASLQPWFELAWVPREPPEPGEWPDMDFDPAELIATLSCPVLAFFGEDDDWVPVDESIERWRAAAVTGGADLTVVRLPGTSHEPAERSGEVSRLYEETLGDWVASVLREGTGARMDDTAPPS